MVPYGTGTIWDFSWPCGTSGDYVEHQGTMWDFIKNKSNTKIGVTFYTLHSVWPHYLWNMAFQTFSYFWMSRKHLRTHLHQIFSFFYDKRYPKFHVKIGFYYNPNVFGPEFAHFIGFSQYFYGTILIKVPIFECFKNTFAPICTNLFHFSMHLFTWFSPNLALKKFK